MKAKIKTSLILMLSLSLILIGTNVYARSGITTSETTRIRSEASTSASTVVLLPVNTEVEIVGEDGDWYQVEYENYSGYIRKDLLDEKETSENEETETIDTSEENNNDENSTETETSENEETEITENNDSNEEISEENTSAQETSTVKSGDQGTLLDDASMRILPSINSSIIAEISASTTYTVVEVINNWCHIEVGNYSGWVFLSKIDSNKQESEKTETNQSTETTKTDENTEDTTTEEETTTSEEETTSSTTTTKYVSAETLNMRETADSSATILTQLALNTEVTVVEEVNTVWTKITYNGYTGYVASQYLSDSKTTTTSRSETTTRSTSTSSSSSSTTETDTTSSSSSNTEESTSSSSSDSTSSSTSSTSSKGAEVAALAKQYVGYKYVSGGSSPSSGFDCSGLVYYVYKQFGVTLNRTATGQSSNGTAVSKSNLQPGDIIVFNNSSNTSIGHVGIYIGSNTFVHAANSRKGVITTSLSESYYSARYVTARRIFN